MPHPAMPDRDGCTTQNWLESPYNRWSFWHVREMTRTAVVRRGTGPVLDLPVAIRPELAEVTYTFGGKQRTIAQGLEDNWADAALVIHEGQSSPADGRRTPS